MRRFILALCAVLLPGSALACPIYAQAAAGYAQPDPQLRAQLLRQALAAAMADESCLENIREQVRRWNSLALYKSYQETRRAAELEEAARFSRQWTVRVALGDYWRDIGHQARAAGRLAEAVGPGGYYERAAYAYLDAVSDIDFLATHERMGVGFAEDTPALEVRRSVQAMAEDLQLLLGRVLTHRAACRFEDVAPGMAPAAFPITFAFNSDRIAPEGEEAAQVLLGCLAQLPPNVGEVAVIGHADPQGDDAYNCGLSIRRAQAVVDFLRRKGARVPLRAFGRGEEQPYRPQGGDFTQEEIWAMSRRVEADVPAAGEDVSWRRSCAF